MATEDFNAAFDAMFGDLHSNTPYVQPAQYDAHVRVYGARPMVRSPSEFSRVIWSEYGAQHPGLIG